MRGRVHLMNSDLSLLQEALRDSLPWSTVSLPFTAAGTAGRRSAGPSQGLATSQGLPGSPPPPKPLPRAQLGTFLTLRPHEAVHTGTAVRPDAAAPVVAAVVTDGCGGSGGCGLRSPSSRGSWGPGGPSFTQESP